MKKQLFRAWKVVFLFANWKGLPFAIALWAAGKAPEKLTGCYKDACRWKWKNNFSGPEKLFFYLPIGRVSLLQSRFGQLQKHLKSSLAAHKDAWRWKWKNNFSGPEKLFFICQLEGSPFCNRALGSWKSTWKAHWLLTKMPGGENEKTTFQGLKSCFFICSWKGLPFAIALWAAGKHLERVSQALSSS